MKILDCVKLYNKLNENARHIGDIENYYGGLSVSSDDGKYYWSIENYDGENWTEIPKELYIALLKYQDEYESTLFEECWEFS